MAGRINWLKKEKEMLVKIGPEAEHPGKHFKEANELIVDMANEGLDPSKLAERLYFLTEGWKEKDYRSASVRLKEILEYVE
jgi:hypothetical protein